MSGSTRNPLLHSTPRSADADNTEIRRVFSPTHLDPVVERRRPRIPFDKESIRELIKAVAIVGALIVALNVYAAIVPASAL